MLPSRTRLGSLASLLSFAAATGCAPEDGERVGVVEGAIANPGAVGTPSFAVEVTVKGFFEGKQTLHECFGSVVAKTKTRVWVLTAAHCFSGIGGTISFPTNPPATVISGVGTSGADAVRFHPKTWEDGATTWTEKRPLIDGEHLYDVALVSFIGAGLAPQAVEPIRLWAPSDYQAAKDAVNKVHPAVEVAGRNGNPHPPDSDAFATGNETIVGFTFQQLLAGNAFPSQLQHGDSGGPAFRVLTNDLPSSVPSFPFTCAVKPGATGDTVLVGVNQSITLVGNAETDSFVPVFQPDIVQWIAATTAADADGDLHCDDEDTCPLVADADAANHNKEAEDAWGKTTDQILQLHFGDKCDAAPTPFPLLQETKFVGLGPALELIGPGGGNKFIELAGTGQYGRAIENKLGLLPVLDDGSQVVSAAAAPFFCDCRDPDLNPIPQPEICQLTPFRCFLDPRQGQGDYLEDDASKASIPAKVRAWHLLTMKGKKGKPAPKGIPFLVHYPGSVVSRTWDYQTDYNFWVKAKGWMVPSKSSSSYPPGTDLGGVLWGHGDLEKGATQHGLPPICLEGDCIHTMNDGYLFGVAPDPKVIRQTGTFAAPAENFTLGDFTAYLCPPYCPNPAAGGAMAAEPILTVTPDLRATFWFPETGGRDATAKISPAFRAAIRNPDALFVPSSEPETIRSDETITRVIGGEAPSGPQQPASPRALVILPEGGGFALYAQVALPNGTMDLAKVESFGVDVLAEVGRFLANPQKRSQIAIVYARTADALFIVHGADGDQPPLPPRALMRSAPSPILGKTPWLARPVGMTGAFRAATRAVFSPRDWRIWVLDHGSSPSAHWRLRRIDPVTGREETSVVLPVLEDFKSLWLSTDEDGRVLLIGNRAGGGPSIQSTSDDKKGKKKDEGSKDEDKQDGDDAPGGQEFVIVALASRPFDVDGALDVDGVYARKGQILMAPKVSNGVISLLRRRVGKQGEVDAIGVQLRDLAGTWPALAANLNGPHVAFD